MNKQKIQIKKKLQSVSNINSIKLKHVDLFAGTGAFTLALSNIVDTVYANDISESSKKIYDLNFTQKLTLGDINIIDPKDIPMCDILTAGPACQPFSVAGNLKGFHDIRSNVFWKIFEILDYIRPKIVIIENVKNFQSHDDGKTFKIITDKLEKLNYNLIYKILNTSDITGIPQNRERIYIIGFQDITLLKKFNFNFPLVPKKQIVDLLDNNVSSKYYYNDTNKIHDLIQKSVTKINTVYQYRRVYVRENKSNECPTLTANMGTGGHNVPIILSNKIPRKLTPRECFRFQGFPESYNLGTLSDSSLYKLSGNAISVPVVKLIADELSRILRVDHINNL